MNELSGAARPAIGRGFRLQWEAAQNAFVLLYPEGMIKLNASAGEILKRCDGAATVDEITGSLEQAFYLDKELFELEVERFLGAARPA